jgi:hypothetical protein
MFIEFQLPTGSAGMAAGMMLQTIKRELAKWSERHNISYTSKTVRYTHRVCFDEDKMYDFFVMSWNPHGSDVLNRYVVVSDRNNRQ